MSITLETLEAEVLRLPAEQRSQLLDRIVASLDADGSFKNAWDAEAARRDAEIEIGASASFIGKEVLARLRAEAE